MFRGERGCGQAHSDSINKDLFSNRNTVNFGRKIFLPWKFPMFFRDITERQEPPPCTALPYLLCCTGTNMNSMNSSQLSAHFRAFGSQCSGIHNRQTAHCVSGQTTVLSMLLSFFYCSPTSVARFIWNACAHTLTARGTAREHPSSHTILFYIFF